MIKIKRKWLDVVGYSGYYQVSNDGSVRSVSREYVNKRGQLRSVQGRVLKPRINRYGYKYVILVKGDGSRFTVCVHRLVAISFIIKKDKKKNHVNHVDGNKSNNHISNLEWVTNAENRSHAGKIGLMKKRDDHPASKITNRQALAIKSLLASGYGSTDISRRLNISIHIVFDIKRNRTWRHI